MKAREHCIVVKPIEDTGLFKAELCEADHQKLEYVLITTSNIISPVAVCSTPHGAIGRLVSWNSTFGAFKCSAHLLHRSTTEEELEQLGKDIASMGHNNRPFAVHICELVAEEREVPACT